MTLSLEGLHEAIPGDARPRRIEGIEVQKIPCCWLLRETGSDKAVKINETGLIIWRLCNGDFSVAEMIDGLKEQYPDAESIEKDVNRAIGELVDEGVVELC